MDASGSVLRELVEQAASAAQSLTEQAANLSLLMARYHVDDAVSAAARSGARASMKDGDASRPWNGDPKRAA